MLFYVENKRKETQPPQKKEKKNQTSKKKKNPKEVPMQGILTKLRTMSAWVTGQTSKVSAASSDYW